MPEQRKPAAAGKCLRTYVYVIEVTLVTSHGVFQNSPRSPGLFCFRYLWVRWECHLTLPEYDTHKEVMGIRKGSTFISLLEAVAMVYPGGGGSLSQNAWFCNGGSKADRPIQSCHMLPGCFIWFSFSLPSY